MVYESDFYTTRRPYRTTPSFSTYTVSKREIPWEKVPFVPRPSLVPDPVTAFGKRKPEKSLKEEKKSILSASERAKIRPTILPMPPAPYMSARDETREKVFGVMRRHELTPREFANDSIDVVLPRLHKVAENPQLPYKRRIVSSSDFPPVW